MSRGKALFITGGILFLLNILPLPRYPLMHCDIANGGLVAPFGQQFGFPLVYLQRSISPTSCTILTGNSDPYVTLRMRDKLANHHAYPWHGIIDAGFALLLLGAVALRVTNRQQGKKHV